MTIIFLPFCLTMLDKNATLISRLCLVAFAYSFNQRNWLHVFETESYDSFVEI